MKAGLPSSDRHVFPVFIDQGCLSVIVWQDRMALSGLIQWVPSLNTPPLAFDGGTAASE